MTDKDTHLEQLFAAARRQGERLPDDLAARMLADAGTVLSERVHPVQERQRPSWRQVFDYLGGWRGMGGLATACAAGIWIGLAPPGFLPDPAELLIQPDATDLFSDLTLSELYVEEG
ncbi:hypothetical protein FGK63_11215 [Ruegeria sediminis]|uniref:Dihydroorotate dehydrogenase n=1 Tax=Ruegeria sediminis TaxID=2583820 RepID=A0ABY2WYR0_9RHOB|nr:hypothetical protein [Ruegeria sediminis]TMV08010.1 hypothetical protein FGK63_11215 [Ruegeria sediminis]